MKLLPALALAGCLTFVGCSESPSAPADDAANILNADNRIELKVDGMDCAGCTGGICSAVKEIEGVEDAHIDLQTGQATIALTDGVKADPEKAAEIEKIITELKDGKYTTSEVTAITPDTNASDKPQTPAADAGE